MLLHSESIRIESTLPPSVIIEAVQAVGKEWRESTLSPTARAAGVLGWTVRVGEARFVIHARIRGRNSFFPYFVGVVQDTPAGSIIDGELRLNWFSRGFMIVWSTCVVLAPVAALFEPLPEFGIGEHIFAAAFLVGAAILLLWAARWLLRSGYERPAAAMKELLLCISTTTPSQV
jgi:hypothetical protein